MRAAAALLVHQGKIKNTQDLLEDHSEDSFPN